MLMGDRGADVICEAYREYSSTGLHSFLPNSAVQSRPLAVAQIGHRRHLL